MWIATRGSLRYPSFCLYVVKKLHSRQPKVTVQYVSCVSCVQQRGEFVRLFEPAWALLEDGLAVTLRDSLLQGYWTDYMASERKGQPHTKHLQVSQVSGPRVQSEVSGWARFGVNFGLVVRSDVWIRVVVSIFGSKPNQPALPSRRSAAVASSPLSTSLRYIRHTIAVA